VPKAIPVLRAFKATKDSKETMDLRAIRDTKVTTAFREFRVIRGSKERKVSMERKASKAIKV
jgi:hypothetical protein